MDGGKLVGLVSSGDLDRYLVTHQKETIRELSRDVEREGFKFKIAVALVAGFLLLAVIAAIAS